ncbi:hypothetical protein ACX93W_26785 [Paenibacillus sp. CAU 1782]
MAEQSREEKIQELRRKVNDTMTYRKMFGLSGSDEMCTDVLWLLEEIERLHHIVESNEKVVSQLREERNVLIETIRWYAIRSGTDMKMNDTFRALGIGVDNETMD